MGFPKEGTSQIPPSPQETLNRASIILIMGFPNEGALQIPPSPQETLNRASIILIMGFPKSGLCKSRRRLK
jgi:hypothetical protein